MKNTLKYIFLIILWFVGLFVLISPVLGLLGLILLIVGQVTGDKMLDELFAKHKLKREDSLLRFRDKTSKDRGILIKAGVPLLEINKIDGYADMVSSGITLLVLGVIIPILFKAFAHKIKSI